jgi:hypothetical protein
LVAEAGTQVFAAYQVRQETRDAPSQRGRGVTTVIVADRGEPGYDAGDDGKT